MRSRIIVGALIVVAGLALTATHPAANPAVKWAAVNLVDTVSIAGAFVTGPVVFVHDDAKMARGEPCTSVHRYDKDKGIGKTLVAFHCTPRWGKAPSTFTRGTAHRPEGPPVMTEYQFAGDEEAHLIPIK